MFLIKIIKMILILLILSALIIGILIYFKVIDIDSIIIEINKVINIDDKKLSANNLVLSISKDELKKYDKTFDRKTIVDECEKIILNNILNQKNTFEKINDKINEKDPDDLILLSYDTFIENAALNGIDPITEVTGTLNSEINNMKSTTNDYFDKLNSEDNIIFPTVIGPLNKKIDTEKLITLKKIILENIDNNINNFINSFDTNKILTNPNYNTFIDNYINSNSNYNEEEIKVFIIKLLINEYNNNIKEIKTLLTKDKDNNNIIKEFCIILGGEYVDNTCTYKLEDCKKIFLDSSNNIFTTYNNNKCSTSAQSGLKKYVLLNNDISNNDITYDFENEKVNITSQYCTKKGLEETLDSEGNVDCKLTKNKPILESIFGEPLLNTIYTKYNYEICDANEIDGAQTNIIPDNLKELIKPLTKKYGPIEKSLCFDKTYGCASDKVYINDACYIKCPDRYIRNPDNKSECYKLYATFENNGEFKNATTITKKIIKNPYLPKNVCPSGYNYNVVEDKCVENCPDNYFYKGNNICAEYNPVRWDGDTRVFDDRIKKNAIYSRSKARVYKCLNPDKPDLFGALCYAKCPPGHVHIPGAEYSCRPEPCPPGYSNTGVTCYKAPQTTTPWYTKGPAVQRSVCPDNYHNIEGVCWANSCPSGWYEGSAGLCTEYCDPGYTDVAGLCHDSYWRGWGSTPHMTPCESWQKDESGSCWERGCQDGWCYCGCIKKWISDRYYCNSDEELEGALCYPKCKDGFSTKVTGGTVNICKTNYPRPRGVSYKSTVKELPSTWAVCGSDRDNIDGLCQPKCRDGYWSSSATTCTTHCPSGYNKTKLDTCQLDADTITNPNIGAGDPAPLLCPDGTEEASPGGICYPNNPPEGYQRHSISLEQWTEKCPDGWEETSWDVGVNWGCKRPMKTVKSVDAVCPANYNFIGDNKCKKDCEAGYEFKNETCIQKCPDDTINNTDTTCGRETTIKSANGYDLPYTYKIKKRI